MADVGQAMYGGVLNLVSNAFCSTDVVDIGAGSAQGLREVVEDLVELIAKPNVSDLFPFLRPLDLQGRRRHSARKMEKVLRVLDGIVDRRLASSASSTDKQQGDFLGTLLELMSKGKITREDVTTILFDVFTAGSDTIAITVEWTMAELLRNPTAMGKVRAEITGALGGKEAIERSPMRRVCRTSTP